MSVMQSTACISITYITALAGERYQRKKDAGYIYVLRIITDLMPVSILTIPLTGGLNRSARQNGKAAEDPERTSGNCLDGPTYRR